MEIIQMKLSDIHPYDKNPRKNNDAVDAVAKSIQEFGFRSPIIVDKDHVIICGHTRYKAAKKLKLKDVPVHVADNLTPEQIQAYRIADNKTGEIAVWDNDLLVDEILSLKDADYDLSLLGFNDEELQALLNPQGEEEFEGQTDPDDAPEAPEEPKSEKGTIYQLGEHRLMCGDSTSAGDVALLLGGEQADLLVTDPPYNVAYEGCTKDKLTIQNDSMDDKRFYSFLCDAFSAANLNMKPGAVFYIWHADSEGFNFRAACKNTNWKVRECLIWNKNSMVMGRQDYQWKHEPCLYGWSDGGSHGWYSDRKQTTVLNFNKPLRNGVHPTMKPVELFAYQICNSSRAGEIVMDLFGGSGTTIIACEKFHRKGRLMELDPKYCDVIRQRWAEFVHGEGCDWEKLTPVYKNTNLVEE